MFLTKTYSIQDCWKYDNNNYNSVVDVHYSLPNGNYLIEFDTYTSSNVWSQNQAHLDLGVVANRIICGVYDSERHTGVLEVRNGSVIQTISNSNIQLNTIISHTIKYENGTFSHTVGSNTVTLTPQYVIPTEITTIRCGSYNLLNNLKIKPL